MFPRFEGSKACEVGIQSDVGSDTIACCVDDDDVGISVDINCR